MIWLDDPRRTVRRGDHRLSRSESTFALGKLYTTRFYRMLQNRLTADAAVVVQSTSPLFARTAFWCIVRTLEAAGFVVQPYHVARAVVRRVGLRAGETPTVRVSDEIHPPACDSSTRRRCRRCSCFRWISGRCRWRSIG